VVRKTMAHLALIVEILLYELGVVRSFTVKDVFPCEVLVQDQFD